MEQKNNDMLPLPINEASKSLRLFLKLKDIAIEWNHESTHTILPDLILSVTRLN